MKFLVRKEHQFFKCVASYTLNNEKTRKKINTTQKYKNAQSEHKHAFMLPLCCCVTSAVVWVENLSYFLRSTKGSYLSAGCCP